MVDPQETFPTTEGEQNESWRIHSRNQKQTQGEVAVHIANIKTYQTCLLVS